MRFHLPTLADVAEQQRMLERLRAFTPGAQRRWGKMSAGGAVCHLALSFEMALGDQAYRVRSGLFERTVLKFGALRIPLQWPRGRVATLPELVEGAPGMRPGVFAEDLARLIREFERFASARVIQPEHPIFGPMSRWDWMRWGYLHTDHHLRQFGL